MVIVEASAPAASAAARSLTQDSETGGNILENVQQEAGSQGTTSLSAVTAMMGGGNPGGPVKSQVKTQQRDRGSLNLFHTRVGHLDPS